LYNTEVYKKLDDRKKFHRSKYVRFIGKNACAKGGTGAGLRRDSREPGYPSLALLLPDRCFFCAQSTHAMTAPSQSCTITASYVTQIAFGRSRLTKMGLANARIQ